MTRRLLAAIALVAICLPLSVLALIWMAVAVAAGSPRGTGLAIGFDQLGNRVAGGDEDEVFSSRCWRLRAQRPYRWLQPAIDGAFARMGDLNHCKASYENELRKRSLEQPQ